MSDEQLERENEKLSALNSILFDTVKNQEKLIKQFRKMLLVVVVCFACITCIICCMTIGFFWYESQFETTTKTTAMIGTPPENMLAIYEYLHEQEIEVMKEVKMMQQMYK